MSDDAAVESVQRQKMKFNKTETEYNMKSIRFLLLTITTMFLIIAGLMIVLGISVYSHYHSFSYIVDSAKSGRLLTPSIIVVFLGLFMLTVSAFGFYGSLKEMTCLVNVYALILVLMLLMKLGLMIAVFTVKNADLADYIHIPVSEYSTDPEIQAEIDSLQTTLNCCGSNSYLDYVGMDFSSNHSTSLVVDTSSGDTINLLVPDSCCVKQGDTYCAIVRTTSCQSALVNLVVQNSSVLGVLIVSVGFIELLGIIFSLLLAHSIRRTKSERVLLEWKRKEQMILARMLEDAKTAQAHGSVFLSRSESSVA